MRDAVTCYALPRDGVSARRARLTAGRLPFFLCVSISILVQVPFAQSRTSQQPTFKAGVELVTLDAIVVDRDGHPVKGLKPDDFIVTIQGQVRPVRLLDFREFGGGTTTEVTGRVDVTNHPSSVGVTQKRGGRIVVIVFDDLSYKPGPGRTLLAATERMLSSFDSDDLIGITTTSGLGPVVTPTRDRSAIVAALQDRKMVGRYDDSAAPFNVTQEEAEHIQRDFPHTTFQDVLQRECGSADEMMPCASQLRNAARVLGELTLRRLQEQLSAYHQVIKALERAPDTPRVIIALSAGVAIGVDASEFKDGLEQVSRTAADSKVQFYAISEVPDEVDLRDAPPPGAGTYQPEVWAAARRAEGRFLNSGIQTVSSAAGGETFLAVGTADRFIRRIESETSGIYRLGVDPPPGSEGLRYLKTSVKVREAGVTVRAIRESVMPGAAAASADPERDLRTRLAEGGMSLGVPLTVGSEMRRDPDDTTRIEIDVSVDVPATVKGPVTVMYGVLDGSGKIIESGRARVTQESQLDYRLAFPVRVSAGSYRLRVAASDATGSIGSVEQPVSAALVRIGRYAISDLLTTLPATNGGPKPVALSAIPNDALAMNVRLELYPDDTAGNDDLQVRFDLLPPGTGEPISRSSVTPAAIGIARVASAALTIQTLAPGSYTIRATILEHGTDVGTTSATFRKGPP